MISWVSALECIGVLVMGGDSSYDLGPIDEVRGTKDSYSHERTFHTPDIRCLSPGISKLLANRPGPESRRGREGDRFGATAEAYAATRGRGNANPQGRGSKIRGDQERFFDVRDAEDGGTPRHPQRKRTAVAKNSYPGAVSTTAGHPGSGHQKCDRGKARRALIEQKNSTGANGENRDPE